MYSLVLIVALAPGAGDLPGDTAVAPPGAGSGNTQSPAEAPKNNGGFFRRLFQGSGKNTPAPAVAPPPAPAAQPAVPNPPVVTTASPAKPKGGFFYNLFHSTDYDKDFDKEKKWEKSLINEPD